MARPIAKDYSKRRAHIADQAIRIFAERGFHGTSGPDIALACKTSKSLIYYYFSAKEDILYEGMNLHLQALSHAAVAVAKMGGGAEDKLRALIHKFLRLYAGAAPYHKVLLNEISHLSPVQQKEIIGRQREITDFVAALLSDISPSRIPSHLRRVSGLILFGMINWTDMWFKPNGEVSIDDVADLITEIALGGVTGIGGDHLKTLHRLKPPDPFRRISKRKTPAERDARPDRSMR